jgi:hypothetical protein
MLEIQHYAEKIAPEERGVKRLVLKKQHTFKNTL